MLDLDHADSKGEMQTGDSGVPWDGMTDAIRRKKIP